VVGNCSGEGVFVDEVGVASVVAAVGVVLPSGSLEGAVVEGEVAHGHVEIQFEGQVPVVRDADEEYWNG
jgi:hypothetical protein